VAQKLRTIVLLYNSEDFKVPPEIVSNSKPGAGPPTRRGGLAMPEKKKLKITNNVNLDIFKYLKIKLETI
jgi:hypothetical protein